MPRLRFLVPLDPGGYRWIRRAPRSLDADPAASLCLVGTEYAKIRRQCKQKELWDVRTYELSPTYDPCAREPALFRVFADLDGSESAVVAFANRYGDIAQLSEIVLEEYQLTLADWRKWILKFRAATKRADQLIRRSATAQEVQAFVDELLEGLDASVRIKPSDSGPGVDVTGIGLLDAMKLQLVDALTERKGYRKCEFCGRPFEIRPQVNRADRIFCSDTCRVKAYKRRKKEALALRQNGLSMREIAKRTNTEIASLKKWFVDQ